jgi:thiol-disulfide isomerase/thioredoxin
LWALALAVVVLTIASWIAFSAESDRAAPDDVVRLGDPSLPVSPGLGEVPDKVGQPASAIPYTTFDGETTSLASRTGRPMVVNFWASYCTPCITEMPAFESVHQRVGDRVDFVGLAVKDSETSARERAASTGVTYDLGFDAGGQVVIDSGGVVLPTTVFIGADGTILETHLKQLDEAGLQERIERYFGITTPGT